MKLRQATAKRLRALLARLADAWDPSSGAETTVLNSDLEEASKLLRTLEAAIDIEENGA